MIPNKDSKKVRICITTFENMDNKKHKEYSNKYICSICLNSRVENENFTRNRRIKTKSCHACHTSKKCNKLEEEEATTLPIDTKNVQTSQPDVTQGLNLLNEVLTVFQKNKDNKVNYSKTSMYKDVSTSTEDNKKIKHKLSISRTFNYSVGDFENKNHNNYMIIDYYQPDVIKITNNSLDLIRHKSSSIPQMKLEELKNSIKVKSKSKDAIEEVNRMFARVTNKDTNNLDDSNRPMTRNGPRVLPVVKTDLSKSDYDKLIPIKNSCKCCQTNFNLSSGDSSSQCTHLQEETYEHAVCCHFKKHRNKRKEIQICECYKNIKNMYGD